MADIIDQANDIAQMAVDVALRARNNQARLGVGPAQCEECDDEMPPERRTIGARLCIFCQQRADMRAKVRGIP